MFSTNGSLFNAMLRPVARGVVKLIRMAVKPEDDESAPPWPIGPLARINQRRMRDGNPSVKEMRLGYRMSTALFHMTDKPMSSMAEHDVGGGLLVRVYRPKGLAKDKPAPAMMFYHGGGFVIGDLETHDTTCRYLAHQAGVVVFSVHYRLAPEHKFPAAVEDAKKSLAWVRANAKMLNINPKKIGSGGDSAGAGISLTLGLSDKKKDRPDFLWLVYPPVDMQMSTPSKEKYVSDLFLTTGVMRWFAGQFLPEDVDMSLPVFSPLSNPHLKDLPPSYIMTVGFDPLCDEGIMLAEKAKKLGVDVSHAHYPRLAHEIFAISGIVPEAKQAIKEAADELKKLAHG